MGPAVRVVADHVVRRHLRPDHGVLPVLQGQELVLIQRVGEPGHVAGREHVVDRHPVHGVGTPARITRDAERATGNTTRTGYRAGSAEPAASNRKGPS